MMSVESSMVAGSIPRFWASHTRSRPSTSERECASAIDELLPAGLTEFAGNRVIGEGLQPLARMRQAEAAADEPLVEARGGEPLGLLQLADEEPHLPDHAAQAAVGHQVQGVGELVEDLRRDDGRSGVATLLPPGIRRGDD